jgi:selenide,water dikinase
VKRLLLLGGGHAHVQVVRAFAASPPPATAVALINNTRLTAYSGMLPGFVAGHYTRAESHIDLAALCSVCGVRFFEQEAHALDLAGRRVMSVEGAHAYDVLSVDTGSTPPLDRIEGAHAHALPVKPVDRFIAAVEAMSSGDAARAPRAIAVVGAGAAGVELILALDHRLRQGRPAALPALRLVTDSARILEEFPSRARKLAVRILRRQGIGIHTGAPAARVDPAGIVLADGMRIEAERVLLTNGAQPHPMFAQAGLQTDRRGFIAVSAGLQSLSHPAVFACGDVAAVIEHPRPKAGVFAVRQGPPLARNLRRALAGEPPLPFVPQRRYLVLLSTGSKHAIATRNGLTVHGEWVWRWKDRIDRRFVALFDAARIGARAHRN